MLSNRAAWHAPPAEAQELTAPVSVAVAVNSIHSPVTALKKGRKAVMLPPDSRARVAAARALSRQQSSETPLTSH